MVAAIIYPWLKMRQNDRTASQRAMAADLLQLAGSTGNILRVAEIKDPYMAYWKDDANLYLSLYMDGAWIVVVKQPLEKALANP